MQKKTGVLVDKCKFRNCGLTAAYYKIIEISETGLFLREFASILSAEMKKGR